MRSMHFFLSFITISISSCSTANLSDLRTEYAKTTKELGLVAVYPPREGVQLGDVFLVSRSKSDPFDIEKLRSFWVDNIPEIQKAAERHLKGRIVYADTQTSPDQFGGPSRFAKW